MVHSPSPRKPSLWKGVVAGLAAGAVATLVMDQVQKSIMKASLETERRKRRAAGEPEGRIATEQAAQQHESETDEGSTGVVARKLTHAATGEILSSDQAKTGGNYVHYTFGTLMGGVYGVAAEYFPEATSGGGSTFGTLFFLGADEVAVAALGLAPPPKDIPLPNHFNHWLLHVVYGTTADTVRRLVRRLL